MKNNASTLKPRRIAEDAIASVAAEGVARALAAREACVRELSAAEIAEVNGGALSLKGIIAGGRRADLLAIGGGFVSSALKTDFGLGLEGGGFNAALTMG